MPGQWMIYGANGYTGRLVLDLALAKGLKPVIAGRDSQSILDLARTTQLPGEVFDLSDRERITRRLRGLDLVLNCAGPFSKTAHPMLNACLEAKVHYLDITGEIDVFEMIFQRERELQDAGIAAVPGVGFDVVPTDALAMLLKNKQPDASRLTLAFKSHESRPSPGTAKTMVEAMSLGSRVRKNGAIFSVSSTYKTVTIPFAEGSAMTVTIPWGDISTAFRSTGIPNIEVHMAATDTEIDRLRRAESFRWVLAIPFMRGLIQRYIGRTLAGPTETERLQGHVSLWGEVENATGQRVSMTMQTPEGYTFTATSALAAVEKILDNALAPGAYTPTEAFGTEFCLNLPGVKLTQDTKALQ